MKYLDYPLLNQLSSSLSSDSSTDLRVHVRFEAYSVKPVGKEKRAFKEREEAYMSEQEGMEEMSFSPEMREAGLSSCFGRLDEKESRKVHFLLVSTLNAAFPDHDFSSLRPDHFTREPSATQVLSYLSGNLLGPSGTGTTPIFLSPLGLLSPNGPARSPPQASPQSSSPSLAPSMANPDLYRALNEVLPMEDCEVYSWFPEPEYDPHVDAPDDPSSEDEDEDFLNEEDEDNVAMDLDGDQDIPASWGGAGMDMDMDESATTGQVPGSSPMIRQKSTSGGGRRGTEAAEWEAGRERRIGGLLWSANYFFYSKRHKRILFLTCWCRNRPTGQSPVQVETTFPAPISASFSSPSSSLEPLGPLSNSNVIRSHRYNHHNHHHSRRSKAATANSSLRTIGGNNKNDQSSTIPIRGMEQRSAPQVVPSTPRTQRFASSAPAGFGTPGGTGAGTGHSPMARMTAGGFKPRQTPARMMMNAKLEAEAEAQAQAQAKEKERARKERDRSGSTTPGPGPSSALTAGLRGNLSGIAGDKGKRVKV
ncbi:hypothetical protein CI109_106487 [Kwoniella shandongensis]|uniref:Uncharacterized protein n=1 Tax=Kwoniella shandongensis TaxID=1734106 RepID=A0A5M6C565_9TREE|nr:uncharacterized protein CI109_002669 [Kwoniella shandongensis]KAA5528912.1 hypothetical protein CI109_002669 [Kwoniella shandongensis]